MLSVLGALLFHGVARTDAQMEVNIYGVALSLRKKRSRH